jgi:hypothetical protein
MRLCWSDSRTVVWCASSGCGIDHAKAENVKAMMDAGLEYGVY